MMKSIHRWVLIFCLLLITPLSAQELDWQLDQRPAGLKILCDTADIPLYVDGQFVGRSPLSEIVQLSPGRHQVSCFPGNVPVPTGNSAQDRYIRDLLALGRKTIETIAGETVEVGLTYRELGLEVEEYQERFDSAPWIGGLMIITLFLLVGWAAG